MSEDECERAIERWPRGSARPASRRVLALGEMGIGNSTSAAALIAALLGLAPEAAVGRGTGVDDRTPGAQARLDREGPGAARASRPDVLLARLGGLEIAAMVGAIEQAAERGVPVLLDGFITGAAALVAVRRKPALALLGRRPSQRGACPRPAARGARTVALARARHAAGEGSGAVLSVPFCGRPAR